MNPQIKILIVDDEELARQTIIQKLQSFGYIHITEAANGRIAFDLLKADTPDLIIADIMMAEMDGLELLKEIRNANLDILYVLLSGYEVFDYAREAMNYHVSNYLLKPIDDKELLTVLENLETELEKRQRTKRLKADYAKHLSLHQSALLQQYLEQLIFHPTMDEKQQKHQEKQLGLSFPFETFAIILFRILDSVFPDTRENTGLLFFCMENIGQELLKEHGIFCYGFTSRNDFCLVCNLPTHYADYDARQLELFDIFRKVENAYKLNLSSEITMGVGFASQRCKLWHAFSLAQKSLEIQILKNQELYLTNQSPVNEKYSLPASQELALRDALKKQDKTILFQCLEDLYLPFFYLLKGQKTAINSLNLQLILLLLKHLREQHLPEAELLGDEFELYQEVCAFSDEKDTLNWMKEKALLCIHTQEEATAKQTDEQLFQIQVQHYISEHYKEQLTLEMIAAHFHFSTSHFSRLFKKVFTINFIKYLMNHRIQEAKRLLISTDIKVYEIGKEVGFHDIKHFYKVFKSQTGYQPSAYREKFKN